MHGGGNPWVDVEAVFPEDSPQRAAAARRAATRPLLPGDHLEIFAISPGGPGETVVSLRRPVYDLVIGVQIGWQCWRAPLWDFSFSQSCSVDILRTANTDTSQAGSLASSQ